MRLLPRPLFSGFPRIGRIRALSSLQARTTLAAGLAALVLFGAGAWETGNIAYRLRMGQTRQEAQNEAGNLLDAMTLAEWPGGDQWGLPYEVDSTGGLIDSSSDVQAFETGGRAFMPLPGLAGTSTPYWGSATARFPSPRDGRGAGLTGADLQAETATLAISVAARGAATLGGFDQATGSPPDGTVRAYVFVTTAEAQSAQQVLDHRLYPVVPFAALFVAGVAFLATRRALRPVELIRARTAAVTATDPRERVAVPGTGDEIARLAVTINQTLSRLDAASRVQRRFVADAAHELRSPLASLLATLEVAETYPERADWPETVSVAAGQARRIQALADDLLLLARFDAAAVAAPEREVDLAALAQDVAADFAARAVVEVRDESDGRARASGNPVQLERMLRNLVDNATRFAAKHVEVQVTVESEARGEKGAHALIRVQDDGPGIPEGDRERIFERFTRLEDDRSRDTGGSGLGLAIVREIAERHRGTVRVEQSERGALLTVRLPLARD